MLKTKFFTCTIPLLTGLALSCVWIACKKDTGSQRDNTKPSCAVFMSFEMETTTLLRVVNQEDLSRLTPEDRIMAMPHRERSKIEACYKQDGTQDLTITMLNPTHPIVYPAGVVDAVTPVGYAKMEVKDGTSTYFDASGAVIKTELYSKPGDEVLAVVQAMASRITMSKAESDLAFKTLIDNGFLIDGDPTDNLVMLTKNNSDGSRTNQIIDKNTQAMVGSYTYTADGKLSSRMMLNVGGTAEAPILKNILIEAPFRAYSDDIPMMIVQQSQIDNFTLTKN